jgi:hypothetical protein
MRRIQHITFNFSLAGKEGVFETSEMCMDAGSIIARPQAWLSVGAVGL